MRFHKDEERKQNDCTIEGAVKTIQTLAHRVDERDKTKDCTIASNSNKENGSMNENENNGQGQVEGQAEGQVEEIDAPADGSDQPNEQEQPPANQPAPAAEAPAQKKKSKKGKKKAEAAAPPKIGKPGRPHKFGLAARKFAAGLVAKYSASRVAKLLTGADHGLNLNKNETAGIAKHFPGETNISVPTLCNWARQEGVELHAGRPKIEKKAAGNGKKGGQQVIPSDVSPAVADADDAPAAVNDPVAVETDTSESAA